MVHSKMLLDDEPVAIVPARTFRDLPDADKLEVGSNTTSSGHPPSLYGCLGPFLDSVYLSGTAELNDWAQRIFDKAIRYKGKRFCWPLAVVVGESPLELPILELQSCKSVPDSRFFVGAKYFEGHSALPCEFCGVGSMQGVRLLVGIPKAGKYAFKLFISPNVLWAIRSQVKDYQEVVNRVLESVSGDSLIPGDFVLRHYELTGGEIHATMDTWGFDWDIQQAENILTLRDTSLGEATSGNDSYSIEIDNDQPILTKRYRYGSTIYVGSRGWDQRQLCIYDKLTHAKANGSITYLDPKWRSCGWDGVAKVWRIEVRHGLGWLKEHGFDINKDLAECEKTLFEKYLEQVRFIIPGTSKRVRRCKTHPFWIFLRSSIKKINPSSWIWKPKAMKINKDAVKLTQMAVGCTASLIEIMQSYSPNLRPAIDGHSCWSPESVLKYDRAKECVLHQLSDLIDDKFLGKRNTPEDIAAFLNQLAEAAAAPESMS